MYMYMYCEYQSKDTTCLTDMHLMHINSWKFLAITTHLYIRGDGDRTGEWNNLPIKTPHGQYLLAVATEADAMYASKQLLEVRLYDLGLSGLAQDL